jgi:Transposase DDE domain
MQRIARAQKKRRGRPRTRGSRRYRTSRRRGSRTDRLPQIDPEESVLSVRVTSPPDTLDDSRLVHGEVAAVQGIALPPLEPRLKKRYLLMVQSHMRSAPELAAGVASLPSTATAFAATQAAWRFLNNERVTLPVLVEPLREVGRRRAECLQSPFLLVPHDWCKLTFDHPDGKRDLTQMTHSTDVGYELTTALLVSADDGSPLAPVEMHLKTAQGVLSTRDPAPPDLPHLDQILPTMAASSAWGLNKPLLHVIDREADSVDYFRQWDAAEHKFLVRGDDRRVKWEQRSVLLSEISTILRERKQFRQVGEATYEGKIARLWVAETEVVLDRPAKKNVKGKRFQRAGQPLSLRSIVAQVRSSTGKVLAQWLLLSNAPQEWATAEKLARCYYWRWRIESFYKLLKSHGQQLEQWQQETGPAIARRMLVAAMACVVVWQLLADESKPSQELKDILIRLSGRQMKRDHPHTAPAVLAGLWVLLSMINLLEHVSLDRLRELAATIPWLHPR